jgi:MSHA pilin protein MshD
MIKRRQFGFSLIEIIFFIVVVSVSVAGVLLVMNTLVKSSADPMVRKQALAIAESMLEEILLKDYAKPVGSSVIGFGGGGSRSLFDCVDDYAGYNTSGGMVDPAGVAVAGLEKYDLLPAISVSTASDLTGITSKKIVVSVSLPGTASRETISLTGYRASY